MKIFILLLFLAAPVLAAPTPTPTETPAPTPTPDPEVKKVRDALRDVIRQLNTKVPGFTPVPTP